MRESLPLLAFILAAALFGGCNTENDDDGIGWNNLGRNCGNGYHADFEFTIEGGETFRFASSADETVSAYYASQVGSDTTQSTQFTYGWEDGTEEVSAGIVVKMRLEEGLTEVPSLDQGVITLIVDNNGQQVYGMQSLAFTLQMDELSYGSSIVGTAFEPVHHAEGTFSGSFIVIQGNIADTVNVSGSFCLHGFQE